MKKFLKSLSSAGLEINYALDPGLSLFGLNISRAKHGYAERSALALSRCISLEAKSVLDVGSGGGHQAASFAASGSTVTCVDYGTSVYAMESAPTNNVTVINTDFAKWTPDKLYDLVWASHVLEHQRNVGEFIEKLIACCRPEGYVCIIVPTPHRRLWGGHVSLWTPGLLAYNIVLAGVDLKDADVRYGYRESWILFKPRKIKLPALTFDSGDLDLLAPFLPCGFRENSEPWC